jgi:transcriptional regulator with XRE-family HTH domain
MNQWNVSHTVSKYESGEGKIVDEAKLLQWCTPEFGVDAVFNYPNNKSCEEKECQANKPELCSERLQEDPHALA